MRIFGVQAEIKSLAPPEQGCKTEVLLLLFERKEKLWEALDNDATPRSQARDSGPRCSPVLISVWTRTQ
jgi:hypothetical protein